ncbi:hypothetical protein BaRGS_00025111 [Batillaria attramentaria]|uniref:Uncharacterized protein n=1 Tax=Batillaria attramentaria TaxID=370345 RepID=A0ABD0K9C3_9CAEN
MFKKKCQQCSHHHHHFQPESLHCTYKTGIFQHAVVRGNKTQHRQNTQFYTHPAKTLSAPEGKPLTPQGSRKAPDDAWAMWDHLGAGRTPSPGRAQPSGL